MFDGYRAALAANRAQLYLDIPTGPFYGFNRPGAKVSQGLIDNWWRQGMMGSVKAGYECIKAFSETDFTEDLKTIDVPVLVIHSEDDQIVPYADSAPLTVKLLKNGTLKTYKDLPHGCCSDPSGDHQRRPVGVHRRPGSRRESGNSADRTGLADRPPRALARWWAWVIATASASAASGPEICTPGRRRWTIAWTCAFSALPVPTTAFLTSRAAYSPTGIPDRAASMMITPRAWPSFKRRLRVGVDEHFLDRAGVGLVLGDEGLDLAGELGEALGERRGGAGLHLAVGEVRQAIALGADQPPAGRAEAGVEAEDDQASRSMTSSLTS